MKKLNLMFAIIAILLLGSNGWSACTTSNWTVDRGWSVSGSNLTHSTCNRTSCMFYVPNICNDIKNVPSNVMPARRANCYGYRSQFYGSGDTYYCPDDNYNHYSCRDVISTNCAGTTLDVSQIKCTQLCDTQTEADSVNCELKGNVWQGGSCKVNHCTVSDSTWLLTSIAACTGSNNYTLVNTDSTCVHSGICCSPDSAIVGNTCKWRCDSLYTACNAKNGYLYAGVLQDTTISGSDSTFTNKCYYNCSYAYNKDSTTSVTDGNTACASPATPIADCTRMPNDFSSVRTTYGDSVYSYDFLTPGSAAYIDSIVLTPCSRFMYRCTVNGKYKYWYSDADIPTGCTNIVKIK